MINLVRGDMQDLEGKLIVYSKITDNEEFSTNENPFLVSLYATCDLDNFVKTFNISKDVAHKLREEGKKLGDYESSELDKFTKNSKDRQLVITPFYTGELIFYEEDTLLDCGHDVLYTGEFHNIISCDRANHLGVDFYQVIYAEQQSLVNKFLDAKFDNELAKLNGMKSYLNKHFINPMIGYAASNKSNDRKYFDKLKDEFLIFAAGKMYDEDVLELIDIIGTYKEFQDYTLISSYVDKIDALSKEDFSSAAILRDKIKTLRK